MPRAGFARKSTSTPASASRAVFAARRPANPEFEREAQKLEERRRRQLETYRGPQGLGVGKGGIRRIQRQIERRIRQQQVVPVTESIDSTNDKAIASAPFLRLIHHLTQQLFSGPGTLRWQTAALVIIKDVAESWLVNLFESANIFTVHAGRVTLMTRDIHAVQRVQKNNFKEGHIYSREPIRGR